MSDLLSQSRRAVLERLFAAFNRHDGPGVVACFSDNIVFEAAAGPEVYGRRFVGKAAVEAAFVATWTDMPDVAWHIQSHTLAGERAFSEWLMTGTRPDGARLEVEGIDLFVFDGELIASKRALRKERPLQPARSGVAA